MKGLLLALVIVASATLILWTTGVSAGQRSRIVNPQPITIFTPTVERIDFDMKTVAEQPPLNPAQLNGRFLYVKYCDACHDRSYAPTLNGETVRRLGPEAFRTKVNTGAREMPGFRLNVTNAEIDQIAAFLSSESR